MSKNYMNDSQASEIVKYISDTMKLPLIGAGGGFAPIGFYGWSADYVTGAPQGWLRCEGQEVNIADYPELATFYASQHGASNYWGGDGITTFAVPDLRGEFIRGAGTNSHANQGSGGAVGEHQDGTEHINMAIGSGSGNLFFDKSTSVEGAVNTDSSFDVDSDHNVYVSTSSTSTDFDTVYTSRPTNTSGVFFVKATLSDAEINAFNVYTPREHQVAWWEEEIDGVWKRKPVYEKRIDFGALPNKSVKSVQHNISNFGELVSLSATTQFTDGFWRTLNMTQDDNNSMIATAQVTSSLVQVLARSVDFSGYNKCYITIRYTKTTDEWQTS